MTPSQIAKTLTDLANGVNPLNGEPLPLDSPCHDARVIRALFIAAQHVEPSMSSGTAMKPVASNAGQPWTREEEQRLIGEFEAGATFSEMAKTHGRSRGGIMARLVRLGKLAAPTDARLPADNDEAASKLGKYQSGMPGNVATGSSLNAASR